MANQVGQIREGFDDSSLNAQYASEESVQDSKGISGFQWIKFGIQAPPGSKWLINFEADKELPNIGKEILIGRTGMYELDDDIIVTSLKYISGDFKNIIIDYLVKEEVSQ